MDIAQILEELSYDTGELPREAIEAAIAKRAQIACHLLAILETAVNRVDEIILQDNYQGHLLAMYLLAQFREKKAYPLIIKLFSFPGEIPHAIAGDILTEDLGRILASVSCGNLPPIKRLIENESLGEYVRAAGLSALVTLVGAGITARSDVIEYLKILFQKKLKRTPSFLFDSLISAAIDLHPQELYPEIVRAFQDHLVDESFLDLSSVQCAYTKDLKHTLDNLYKETELIEDTVVEMEKWFSQESAWR